MQKSLQEKKCWPSKTDSTRWNSIKCRTREWKNNLDVALTSWATITLKIKWVQLPSWRNKQMLGNSCLPELKTHLELTNVAPMRTTQTLSSRKPTSKADLVDSTQTWLAKHPRNVLALRQAHIKQVSMFHQFTVKRNLPLPFLPHITARSKMSHRHTLVRNKMHLHLSTVMRRECHHHNGARSHQFQIPPAIARAMPLQVLNIRIPAPSGLFVQVASRNLEQLLFLENLRTPVDKCEIICFYLIA